ncbi:MBL fold metallo-hydrolase [Parabacteroides sp. 52]|uniref:MBL fold metallo-hydrolase n=1 Tax=unclassified Parabacteroides TaxID=2649774 RepID=UPI0013D0B0B3|nr:MULTISPECIES: MBL fold metallo-hydrolase [unclassified Parabacteroides]MDH6535692.1 phosphoribosyl 1,2-cyclic phosphodiesterase [Parabacteroides sp. PM5-20]NDV56342.1 MBL fold metallo-hydrolase [Parabacteroides sp. 52]
MKLTFISLASGSSGNCYYLGTSEYGILIDAGIGIRTIKKALKDFGIDFSRIIAVLITHDHADHIKTVGCLGERCGIPVYATQGVHQGIERSRYVEETLYSSRKIIDKESPFLIRDFKITAFEVPHDSTDNVGYHIEYNTHRFTFATDVGHITETVSKYMSMAHHLIIEANYDEEMLRFGSYPSFLKERVASPTGHLSNREAADFLATHYHPELKNIWLCHLSKDNNHPELAYKTVDIRLFQEGIRVGKDVTLTALKRNTPSDVFEID